MPKYYCDYCDTYLTHDSPSVRKTHCSGRKHKDNVRTYYQTWMEEQAQELIDKTTQAFQQGKIANNPFGMTGVAPVPPQMMTGAAVMRPGMAPMMGAPPMAVPMPGQHMMMQGQAPQMMGVRAMRPPMQAPPQMMMMSGPPPRPVM